MKISNILFLFLAFTCFFSQKTMAQDKVCGTIVTQAQIEYMRATKAARDAIDVSALENETHIIPVQIHIVREDDGSNGISLATIEEEMLIVNQRYAPINMFFQVCTEPNYIDNSAYDTISLEIDNPMSLEVEVATNNKVANVINIYFVPELVGSCGWASFSSGLYAGRDWIMMDNDCSNNGSTLAHEIGHYFDLFHTHETTEAGAENVTRNPNSACYNCADAGDGLCDTPADPTLYCYPDNGIYNVNPNTCEYIGIATDECDVNHFPPTRNIMSYSCPSCRTEFTQGQYSRMLDTYMNERSYLDASICGPLDCEPNYNLESPIDDISSGTTIKYEASNIIMASNVIQNGANVIYDAAYEITLDTGFYAQSGATALMIIEGCGGVFKTNNAFTDLESENIESKTDFRAYPNPFSTIATLEFDLAIANTISIAIYNINGQVVATLAANEIYSAGTHRLDFDANELPTGTYICKLQTDSEVMTKKLMLLR